MRNVYVTSATNSTSDIGKPYQYLNKTTWSRHIVVMNISHNAEERYALYLDTTVGCHKTNFLYISLNHKNQGNPTSAVPRDATNSNRVLLLDFSYLRLLLKVCFQLYSILNFFGDCFWYLLFIINSCMFLFYVAMIFVCSILAFSDLEICLSELCYGKTGLLHINRSVSLLVIYLFYVSFRKISFQLFFKFQIFKFSNFNI